MGYPIVTLDGLDITADEGAVLWAVPREGIRGWYGSPGGTDALTQRARAHGANAGQSWLAPRSLTIEGTIVATSRASARDALTRLSTAAALSDVVLTITEDDGSTAWASVRRRGPVLETWVAESVVEFSVGLDAPNPRRFGPDLTVGTALPSTTGGSSFPMSFPMSYDAVTVTGQVSLTNPGNITGPVRLRIDGPVTAPVITHVSSGRALRFASSLTLGVGEFVTVDMELQQVLAQGQPSASRAAWVTSAEWSGFEPGLNVWAFTAGVYSATAHLTVTAVPAWG